MGNFVDIPALNALFKDFIIAGIIVTTATNFSSINCSVYNNSCIDNK